MILNAEICNACIIFFCACTVILHVGIATYTFFSLFPSFSTKYSVHRSSKWETRKEWHRWKQKIEKSIASLCTAHIRFRCCSPSFEHFFLIDFNLTEIQYEYKVSSTTSLFEYISLWWVFPQEVYDVYYDEPVLVLWSSFSNYDLSLRESCDRFELLCNSRTKSFFDQNQNLVLV